MMNNRQLTRIRRAREQAPPPYRCTDVRLWAFLADANREAMDTLCADLFRNATEGAVDYRPIDSHVMLSFGHIPKITSQAPGWADEGSIAESHAAIWILVKKHHIGAGPRYAVFNPFMWVDNPMSL